MSGLTKADLLKMLDVFPDNAEVVVSVGPDGENFSRLPEQSYLARVYAVCDTDRHLVILEL